MNEKEITFEQAEKLAKGILKKALESERVGSMFKANHFASYRTRENWNVVETSGDNQIRSTFRLFPRFSKPKEIALDFTGCFCSASSVRAKKIIDELFDAVYSEAKAICEKEGVKLL